MKKTVLVFVLVFYAIVASPASAGQQATLDLNRVEWVCTQVASQVIAYAQWNDVRVDPTDREVVQISCRSAFFTWFQSHTQWPTYRTTFSSWFGASGSEVWKVSDQIRRGFHAALPFDGALESGVNDVIGRCIAP